MIWTIYRRIRDRSSHLEVVGPRGSSSRGGFPLLTFAIQSVIPAAPIIDWLYTIAFHMILLHCTKQFRAATFYFLQEKKIERITTEKERKKEKEEKVSPITLSKRSKRKKERDSNKRDRRKEFFAEHCGGGELFCLALCNCFHFLCSC